MFDVVCNNVSKQEAGEFNECCFVKFIFHVSKKGEYAAAPDGASQIRGSSASAPSSFLPSWHVSDAFVSPSDVGFRYVLEYTAYRMEIASRKVQ